MNLIHDVLNKTYAGYVMPVPAALQHVIAPWAKADYRKYDFGYTLVQELVTRKFSVHSWRFYIDKAAKLYLVCDKPTIALQFTLTGRMICEIKGYGEKKLEPSKCELFYMAAGASEIWFNPGKYELLYIELDSAYLEDIAEVYTDMKALLNKVSVASKYATSLVTANINYVMKAILKNMRNCRDTGAGLKMEMQKYILELLSEYIHETREVAKDRALEYVPYKDTLVKIKQWIMESPDIHVQTQERVTAKYGISLTALKMNFRALFGLPLARFVRFHALNKAHYLIATTRQSIDDISGEVGYSNRTAFNQAFKKQFRYLPSSVRGNTDTSDQIQQE